MSSQQNAFFTENQLPEIEPDFPHAWTFSAQRYVPRPRPVARIILPSHQRVSDAARPEPPSPVVVFSRTESLQPLLRLAREGDDLARFSQGTWVPKLYSLCKRLYSYITAVETKVVACLRTAWSPVHRGSRLLWKSIRGAERLGVDEESR
ncbi:hypothetical protein D9756_008967 [Leucocoprinus leucothites]|uniref:Uncharacterized protein n=1 Tax=Leucocoprinus leucothites TaxID=201217 RepID=A0A8H5FTZ7_9AGAR|nr:hypothetical protein D9756_008967 [Leucoagaricus leucothites]